MGMGVQEIKRLPEDIEAEQRYLAELKASEVPVAAAPSDVGSDAFARLLPSADTSPQPERERVDFAQLTGAAPSNEEDDSDEAALLVLHQLNLENESAPQVGVVYRVARYLDDLMAAIFKRPTF